MSIKYMEDLPIGAEFDLGTKTLTTSEIVRFAREYDPQPFHVDPSRALESSFGGLVASGLQTFGIFSRLVTDAIMGHMEGVAGAGIDGMRWLVPVRPGDTLRGRATILEGTRPSGTKPDRGIVVILGELENQHGQIVWRAEITSVVKRRP
jgi:acyl dehydratase